MALVFPIINDPDQATDAAPSNTWVLDSSPQLPTRGVLESSIVSHNGQLVFQWQKYGTPVNDEHISVYRQGSLGWNRLNDGLKNRSDANTYASGDVASWNGDLYTAFREGKDSAGSLSYRLQVAKWDEAGSSWSFETSSTNGLHPASGYSGDTDTNNWRQPRFFVYDGDLHIFFTERVGTGTGTSLQRRAAICRRNGGSWTRVASGSVMSWNQFAPGLATTTVQVVGSNAWYLAGGQIFRFNGSAVANMHTDENYWLSSGYSYQDEATMHEVDGKPSVAFTQYKSSPSPTSYYDSNNFYYLYQTADGGTSWTSTQVSRPLANGSTSYFNSANFTINNGKQYVLVAGRGPGVTTTGHTGLWAYRLDGASWTQLGGGQARANPAISINSITQPFFYQGAIWVAVLEQGATTSDPMTVKFYKTAK